MGLNKKGYLIVEIIVASVIAMSIMYFLMEITIKIKDINEDYYVRTKLETDKVLMTREVMNDINSMDVTKIETTTNTIKFTFVKSDKSTLTKMIKFTTAANKTTFQYGEVNGNDFNGDVYTKTFDQNLTINGIDINNKEPNDTNEVGSIDINVGATNIYSDIDFGLDFSITYRGAIEIINNSEGEEETCLNGSEDTSGANSPDLVDGLIPITYDGNKWVKADDTNNCGSWYNYNEKKWANAVLVSSSYRDTYENATVGTEIVEDAVLAYYVWLPRYKYKVWNKTKIIGTDSYDAKNTGIDIVFESETETTGTISCTSYSFGTGTSAPKETCSGSNGDYYTHPAFTFGDDELRGVWISKFELTSSSPNTTNGGGTSTSLTPRFKPNLDPWANNPVDNFSLVIQNMQADSNEYGLTTDKTVADSHMIKNIEWGAVAYLTNSKYGLCTDGVCSEIGINNYVDMSSGNTSTYKYMTGCGAVAASSEASTCSAYNTTTGMLASTTGNIYGVYDMSGGLEEYVMGNQSSASGSYTYNAYSAGSNFSYSDETAKYIDTYAYGTTLTSQSDYYRARLGDATGEVATSSRGWYSDYANFIYNNYPWFRRGGFPSYGEQSGIFAFYCLKGDAGVSNTTRAILVSLQ